MQAEPVSSPSAVAPSLSATAPATGVPRWHRWRRLSHFGATLTLTLLGTGALVGWLSLRVRALSTLSPFLFLAALLIALGTLISGVVALVKMRRAEVRPTRGQLALTAIVTTVFGLALTAFGALVAFIATASFNRGRQLRRYGRILLAKVEPGEGWNDLALRPVVPDEWRFPLAAQWRENGRTEHASVAAFARLTLDLMALGAPPSLLEAAQADGQDELRHAELCFSLARGLDGRAERPAAFPQAQRARTLLRFRPLALAQLAVDSLVDGALHEGVSARVIAQLAHRCEVPEIRAVLKELAADEGRHCAHGWDVVEWCLQEGGWVVASALRGALRAIPRNLHSALPAGAADGSWEHFGIHGHALEHAQYARARHDIARRVEALCGAPRLLAA